MDDAKKESIPPTTGSDSGEIPQSSSSNAKQDDKTRVDRHLVLSNPEAISDPEYSDEENVLPGEEIRADEGTAFWLTDHYVEQ